MAFIKNLIKSDFISVLTSNTMVKFIAFFPSVFLARLLTKNQLAAVSYADNILSYLLSFAGLGFSATILRFCAKEDEIKSYGYFNIALKYTIWSNIFFGLLFAIVCYYVDFSYADSKYIFYALLATPLLQNIYDILMNYMRTRGRFKEYSKINVLFSLFKLFLLIILTYFFSINGMIIARYIAVIAIIYVCCTTIKDLIRQRAFIITKGERNEFVKYSLLTVVTTACVALMPMNAMFILNNILKDPVSTANYKVAMALPYNMMFITGAIIIYFTPFFAAREHDLPWIRRTSFKIGVATLSLYTVIAIVFNVFSSQIMFLIYGEKYLDAASLMGGLAIAYGLQAGCAYMPMNILYALGYVKHNIINLCFTMFLELFLDIILIKKFKVQGIVYATIISSAFSALVFWLYLIIKTRIGGNVK